LLFWEEIKRPATAIAITLALISTVAGIFVSLYLYHRGERHPEIAFTVEQVQVFDKAHVGAAPLTILDAEGHAIENNIFAASIIIWNNGNTEIKKEEVREPYQLVVRSNHKARILDISSIFFSRNNADQFSVNRQTGEISWQHFDEGEGLKLSMVYADQTMSDIDLAGYSVNTTIVNRQKIERLRGQYRQTHATLIYWLLIPISIILASLLIHSRETLLRQWKQNLLLALLGACTALPILFYTSPPTAPTPPTSLLSVENQ
jgi:hypothetical protein